MAFSSPPTDPPIPTSTPSTSTSAPLTPIVLPPENIPQYPVTFAAKQLSSYRFYSDEQFLMLAGSLKEAKNLKNVAVKAFMVKPVEVIAASIKRQIQMQLSAQQ